MSWEQIAQWPVAIPTESNNSNPTETYVAAYNGKCYVLNTMQTSIAVKWQFYEYNISTNTYTSKALPASHPSSSSNVSEWSIRAFLSGNGHIYFMGGTFFSGIFSFGEGWFADYTISSNSWSYRTKPGDVGVGTITGSCYSGTKIWVSENPATPENPYFSGPTILHYYDTATNTWTIGAAYAPDELTQPISGSYDGKIILGNWHFDPSISQFTEYLPAVAVDPNQVLDPNTLEPTYVNGSYTGDGGYINSSFVMDDVLVFDSSFGEAWSISLTDPRPYIGGQQFTFKQYLAQQGIQYKDIYAYNSASAASIGVGGSIYKFLPFQSVTQSYPTYGQTADRRCFKYTPDGIAIAPSTVTPSGTINTDTPSLSANVLGSIDPKIIEWQLAEDPAFTVNKKIIFDYQFIPASWPYPARWAVSSPTAAGGLFDTQIQPGYGELHQGTWYLRSRVAVGGFYSPWSATNTLTVTHPPALSTVSPINDTTLDFGADGSVILQWNFSDTSSTDVQTAFQIIVENNADGTLLLDTGKYPSQLLRSFPWNLPAANKDLVTRWKIRGWDSDDVAGSYSPYALFRMSDKPTVEITSPIDGSQVTSGRPVVTWTFTASASRTQASYRVKFFYNSETLVFDSGVIAGNDLSFQPDEQILDVGPYSVQVEVTDNRGLSNTDTVEFSTSYDAPDSPVFAVNSGPYSQNGYIDITWGSVKQDYAFSSYVVYRRIQGETNWDKLGEMSNIQGEYSWKDYSAASNVLYEYVVTQMAYRFAVVAESSKAVPGPMVGGGTSEQYWLVHPTDPSLSVLLRNVNSEEFTDEQETEELLLIGRGRHMDLGTRWGYKGTITAQIRNLPDGTSAREVRMRLDNLRLSGTKMYLRNPFGDVWLVALSDVSFKRVAGVGTQEFLDVTIPYSEVA